MNFNKIRYFLSLCDTLNFTKSARKLGISQPALTKSIRQLEGDFGTRLIRREGRHTHLTPHGEVVRQKFQCLFEAVCQVEAELVNSINCGVNVINIAVMRSIDFSRFASFLRFFHQQAPHVQFNLSDCAMKDCAESLMNGRVDCVLGLDNSSFDERVERITLFEDSLEYITAQSSELSTSATQLFIHQQHYGEDINHRGLRLYSEEVGQPRVVVQSSQELWIRQLLAEGLGQSLVSGPLDSDSTAPRKDSIRVEKRQVVALLPPGRHDNDHYSNFIAALKDYDYADRRPVLQ